MEIVDPHGNRHQTVTVDMDALQPTFEPSFADCNFGSSVHSAHWSQMGVLLGFGLASIFGMCLGVYQFCACRQARIKEAQVKKKY